MASKHYGAGFTHWSFVITHGYGCHLIERAGVNERAARVVDHTRDRGNLSMELG